MTRTTKKGLGRGLSALISSKPTPVQHHSSEGNLARDEQAVPNLENKSGESRIESADDQRQASVQQISISLIHPNPDQPRQNFLEEEIEELRLSIEQHGLLQPVLVRPDPEKNGHYQIVAGERRYRAATKANLSYLPVIIHFFSDLECLEVALIENVQRSDLSPLEEARAYQRLSDEFSLSQKEVAERVGKQRSTVANTIRLLKLPSDVQAMIDSKELSLGHAKAILTVKEPAAQLNLAKKVVSEGLSVRDLESIVLREVELSNKPRKNKKRRTSQYPEVEAKLRDSLGTKVRVTHSSSGKGKIEVLYFSEAELDRLVDKLT